MKKNTYEKSCGNVFADLGLSHPDLRMKCAQKSAKIIKLHKGNGKPQKIDFNKLCMEHIKKSFLKITPQPVQHGADSVDRG